MSKRGRSDSYNDEMDLEIKMERLGAPAVEIPLLDQEQQQAQKKPKHRLTPPEQLARKSAKKLFKPKP